MANLLVGSRAPNHVITTLPPLFGAFLEPPGKSRKYHVSLAHASKAQLGPKWIQKVVKVIKMVTKASKKRNLKWDWTLFCRKTADMQFDPLFTLY